MLTEEEAKARWCPFVRAVVPSTPPPIAFNRVWDDKIKGVPEGSMCIASDCMAWRWHTSPTKDGELQGRCGLAGPAL